MTIRTARIRLPLLLSMGMCAVVLAQGKQPIGVVVAAKGRVEARDEDGVVRPLSRRQPLHAGDTILTDADGITQFRMADESQISLSPDSSLSLNAFMFDGDSQTPDTFIMSLSKGSLRTLTGTIGDAAADQYELNTPVASVVSDGATYGVVLRNGALYAEVSQGSITVANDAGKLGMGIAASWDYSETKAGQAPQGLIEPPPAFK